MGTYGSARGAARGWLPDSFIVAGAGGEHQGARARHTFSAAELDCRAGQILVGSATVHDWVWCRGPDGTESWVPDRNLA